MSPLTRKVTHHRPCPNCGGRLLGSHATFCGKPFDEAKFWSRMERLPWSGCWIWLGACNSWGYGTVGYKGGNKNASRVAWMVTHGDITEPGIDVLHTCDEKLCCNPAHMYLGTDKDNSRDRVVRGQQPKGERVHFAKLTEAQVREIRRLHVPGRRLQAGGNTKELAKKYGVQPGMITAITSGRTWKHVA